MSTTALADGRGAVQLRLSDADSPITLYSNSYALVIGIDSYEPTNGWSRLSNAINDARAVSAELKKRGFEVELKTDLDANALEDAVESFVYQRGAEPEARLLIWFAGHGHTIGGEAYLLPRDAPRPEDWQFRRKALSLRDFGKYMREVRSKHVLAIFDSCFSGKVFHKVRSRPPEVIAHAVTLPVRQMVSSGEAEQEVSDDGTFRKLFIDALTGEEPHADANRDGYLTGSELGLFLETKITNLSGRRQIPRYGKLNARGLDRGDFVFRVGPGGDTPRLGDPTPNAPVLTSPAKPKVDLTGTYTALLGGGGEGDLKLRTDQDGNQVFSTEIWFEHGHACVVNGTAIKKGHVWLFADGGSCELEIHSERKGKVRFRTRWGASCEDYCGARAVLDDIAFQRVR